MMPSSRIDRGNYIPCACDRVVLSTAMYVCAYHRSMGASFLSFITFQFQAKEAAQQAAKRAREADEKHGFTQKIRAKASSAWTAIDKVITLKISLFCQVLNMHMYNNSGHFSVVRW